MDIRPDYANIMDEEGKLIKADPRDVKVGNTIYVKGGEKVPLDGILTQIRGKESEELQVSLTGTKEREKAYLDTSALTGESKLREVRIGDQILSGMINQSSTNLEVLSGDEAGLLEIKVTKPFGESTVSKILELVENAQEKKSKSEAFITRFARVYTPIVCGLALLVGVGIPLVSGLALGLEYNWSTWIYRALTFLVISCPCALVISIPLSFFAGLGGASKAGILIKGSNYLEALTKVGYIAFDKTGTLTKGIVSTAKATGYEEEEDATKDASRGVTSKAITAVTTSEDEVKVEAREAIKALKALGIKSTYMLTGDTKAIGETIGTEIGIDRVYSELLPQDKVGIVEELLEEKGENERVCYVGDGINDAPVLMRSDVGIAMGLNGTDSATEAADIVLMDDNLLMIPKAIKIAKKCMKIVYENIALSIGVKVACMALTTVGITGMWLAIFADTGVMVLAVLNAVRALNTRKL